jgi:signal transduction histidine kinase
MQGDGSSIRRHGGIGIGLPIARKLVELMGGEIKLESEMGSAVVSASHCPSLCLTLTSN